MADEEPSWFESLFSSGDSSPKEREMVRRPVPQYVKPEQGADETNLDYGMRIAKSKRDHRAAMKEYEADPFMPAAEAAPVEPEEEEGALSQYGKGIRGDIEEVMKDYE